MGATREVHVLDAPSNLGLRPPEEGSAPVDGHSDFRHSGTRLRSVPQRARTSDVRGRAGEVSAAALEHMERRGVDAGRRGAEVTVFDPDLDPDGSLAATLTDHLVAAFTRRAAR